MALLILRGIEEMRILFTGFDPFGGEKINPAGEAVKMMKNEIHGAEILKLEVPTVFGKAGEVLKKAVEQYRPDAVVCVGQAGGRAAITPEMIAVNIMDARIPDNDGNKPCHELIIKEGREAYFSSLPVKDIEKNLNDNGIPSAVSYHAGTFVCNYLMYSLMNLINTKYPNMRGGFVHVPYSTEQVQNRTTPVPSMQLSEITRGLEIIAETLAK